MDILDYIVSEDRDEIAVYLNGVLDDVIYHLTVDDFLNYSEEEYIQVKVQMSNDALEHYLSVHEEWPTRLKYVRDIMEG